jgi:hypothetical protein
VWRGKTIFGRVYVGHGCASNLPDPDIVPQERTILTCCYSAERLKAR